MDINYRNRSGTFYPNEGAFMPNLDNCPEYWKNESNKVEIKVAELKGDFYQRMGTIAYTAGMVNFSSNVLIRYISTETNWKLQSICLY